MAPRVNLWGEFLMKPYFKFLFLNKNLRAEKRWCFSSMLPQLIFILSQSRTLAERDFSVVPTLFDDTIVMAGKDKFLVKFSAVFLYNIKDYLGLEKNYKK